ncbi:hypothetical protein E1262_02390 [Jiangella aurantiaca]|uniref:Fumarate lyase N-terminal domain-containing protein n=1 Tax=Jiangella aurantiaca TaxID=2530373 RepID=A0A4R5AJG6_9ACTN|nr:lyase family protein [Jiangella aurantiaca]TDD72721.1 hypothetical protein E1262_02390 [Jiangella aurantiaca]
MPMTVGQEFAGWAATMREELPRLEDSRRLLHEVNPAGTAIGTQITTVPGYREAVLRHLVTLTGLPLVSADDLIEAGVRVVPAPVPEGCWPAGWRAAAGAA